MILNPSMNNGEYLLNSSPKDGISRVFFSPNDSNLLLVSSWDKTVGVYNLKINQLVCRYFHQGPVLDCCLSDDNKCYSVGLDRNVISYDIIKEQQEVLGMHQNGVRCVSYCKRNKIIASGSWDKTVKLWDTKSNSLIKSIDLPGKVYTMDFTKNGEKLIIGTNGRGVHLIEMNKGVDCRLFQNRKSPLLHQTRCIRCSNDDQGYALSSVEGRIAIEFFNLDEEIQKKKYAFKCHRIKQNGIETLYPVNALCFHPSGSFVSGGCDGKVISWDPWKKKRIKLFKTQYPTSVSSLSYNCNGNLLAVASSYTYEMGEKEHPKDSVYIKEISRVHYEYIPKVK